MGTLVSKTQRISNFKGYLKIGGVVIGNWTDNDKKKVQYDLKARNILISTICLNEYQSVSHCKAAKAILDALETLHEGTEDVKQSKSIFLMMLHQH
ncbi:hypothetical protein MTR_6g088930 [Medicago truncatula]|uniref:Uncharacterized protein n=1 Tax=Medicago truncatula TaxID=3880 RepID=G7KPX6_MEDTR|nr:hypothetical protein MTR_6g088930 [Medicago truncatula]